MTMLAVPGARLHYEVRGSGPILLFIPGGSGDADPYGPVARLMSDQFTTVIYDRRGFSRSALDDPASVPHDRLAHDVADVMALLSEVATATRQSRPAYVFGSSSGAIVGLQMLARYPARIRVLIAHEPPLMSVLPDYAEIRTFFDDVYQTGRRDGVDAAMAQFSARVGLGQPPDPNLLPAEARVMFERMHANNPFFIEHELRQYTSVSPDYGRLQAESSKIKLVGGAASRDQLPYRPNLVLAEQLAREVVDLPGDHIGYATMPVEFATALRALLPEVERDGPK